MDHKPTEEYWKQFLSLPLWKLVVLSLDVEPRSLRESEVYEGELSGWPDPDTRRTYYERLSIAINHMTNGNLKPKNLHQPYRCGYEYYLDVRLSDFVSWSQSPTINWEIPDWLKNLALNSEQPDIPQKPNVKEENAWAKLLGAVFEIAGIDYSEPYTVGKRIVAQTEARGTELSLTTIVDKIKKIPSRKK